MRPNTASPRSLRAAATGASSVAAKGLAGVVMLVSIPLTLRYLGPERFGLWMTITSLQAILAFADFGLGNSLLSTVAEASGRKDDGLIGRAVLTALAMQAAVAALLLLALLVIYPHIGWSSLLNVRTSTAKAEAGPALAVFVAAFCIRSVVVVIQQAQLGLQQGYIANAWTAAGNLASLAGVILAARFHCGVPILCAVVTGLPVAAGVLNATWWVTFRLPGRRPRLAWTTEKRLMADMAGVGALFFLLQLFAALNVGVDPLIVNRALGPTGVASLSVVQKPFEMLGVLLLLLLQPLWPAYREAVVSGDVAWVRNTFRRVLIACLALSCLIALLMITAGPWILHLWLGPGVQVSEPLIEAYAAVLVFSGFQTPLAFLFNGLGKIGFQLAVGIPAVALSMALKVFFAPRLGLASVPWTTCGVGLVVMVPAQIVFLRRLLRDLTAPRFMTDLPRSYDSRCGQ